MLLSADMLCLVQSFQQAKAAEAKSSKLRKLPFIRRKKSSTSENQDEKKLLHPDMARETSTFWRQNKPSHKLSGSVPSMMCPSLDVSLTPSTCRSRQKKFLRHFKVDPEEKVIDYFSCALVADILLQGHLYISKNYFAFYSNVFGYVTRLLIPTSSVVTVTKEKTAYILPNAVGVTTADDRHVFSSLLSRDTTFRLMVQIWRSAHTANITNTISAAEEEVDGSVGSACEESSSQSGSESTFDSKSITKPQVQTIQEVKEISQQSNDIALPTECHRSLPRSTLLLTASTTLLIVLFLSVSVLMYRVSQLQHSRATQLSRGSRYHPSRPLYEFQEVLDSNLNNLYKVRQSLEALSILIESEKEKLDWKREVYNNLEDSKLIEKGTSPVKSETEQRIEESPMS